MASFSIKHTPPDVRKDIKEIINKIPTTFKYHTGEVVSEVITHRNIKFKDPIYVCVEKGVSKVTIFYLQGIGALIFSLKCEDTPDNHHEDCGFINEEEQADIKIEFPCIIIITSTSPLNEFVIVKE
ncbi:SWPV1-290 [Shearwaterpox virus]|uniref:SWPV1-290 n=1 Tax=Shearwaterpox virus TaxID=1974596 RepID=A0A1V0S8F7_CNPV|nr:SWPV1-290 [Shearwaterpox virus]